MVVQHYRGGPQIMPVDSRGRMSLGPSFGGKSFMVQTHEDGTITLSPIVDVARPAPLPDARTLGALFLQLPVTTQRQVIDDIGLTKPDDHTLTLRAWRIRVLERVREAGKRSALHDAIERRRPRKTVS